MLLTLVAISTATAAAQASQPETPSLAVTGVYSSGATLLGTLNPAASEPRESGTYQFVYRPSTSGECKGSEEAVAPSTPGISTGLEHEELFPESIAGLSAGTEYAACLVATEPGKTEPAVSAPVTFKTRVPPEQPEAKPATEVTSSTATFNGIVNPNAPGEEGETYNFVYQAESEECRGEAEVSIPEAQLAATTEKAEPVSVHAVGLLPNTTYTYCVLVGTEFGEFVQGGAVTFKTPIGAPVVSSFSASNLRPTEVTLSATLNPGNATTTVELVGSGVSVPPRTLPASKLPVLVQQHLSGLTPATTYVVHLAGVNEAGRGEAELTFTTTNPQHEEVGSHCANRSNAGFSLALPDCRAAELVSPPEGPSEVYDPGGELTSSIVDVTTIRPFRAAADGSRVAYVGDPGVTGGDGSTGKGHGNEYLATRGDAGWAAENITPPVGEGESASAQRRYTYFSPDLSSGVVTSQEPLLAASPMPQLPENCSGLYDVNPDVVPATYSALFTATLSPAFCGSTSEPQGRDSALFFAAETPDHAMKVFDSDAALVEPAVQSPQFGSNIYASSHGGPQTVVNVLPGGAVEPAAVAGGPSELPDNGPDLSNVVAPSGNRVFWSSVVAKESTHEAKAAFPKALYARENPLSAAARTIQLDEAASGAPGPSGEGQYWSSAAGGDEVFFTDCHRLTTDSTAHDEEGCQHVSGLGHLVRTGSDLYMYDFSRAPGERLVDLTVDPAAGDPLGADVQGVIGTSEDGHSVYFVAGGTLGAGPNADGDTPHPGSCETPPEGARAEAEGHVPAGYGCNLFELHFNGATWEAPDFIAALAPLDDQNEDGTLNDPEVVGGESSGDWIPGLGSRTAEVTPDGGALIFSSTQELTGYDVAAAGGAPGTSELNANEIFLYNAAAKHLTCVSCDPQNRPPDIAAIQKSAFTYLPVSSSDTFLRRWVNSSGTEVFFDSSQPLNEGDVNGRQDVYEWAAQGTSSCPTATSVFGGCIFLLSSGEAESESFLADADETGSNVFLVQRGPLDGVGPAGAKSVLYDLRASGGEQTTGSGCTLVSTCPATQVLSPTASAPASSTVSGAGNFPPQPPPSKQKPLTNAQKLAKALKSCRAKRSHRKRAACEHLARRRYAPSHKRNVKKARFVPTHERRK